MHPMLSQVIAEARQEELLASAERARRSRSAHGGAPVWRRVAHRAGLALLHLSGADAASAPITNHALGVARGR